MHPIFEKYKSILVIAAACIGVIVLFLLKFPGSEAKEKIIPEVPAQVEEEAEGAELNEESEQKQQGDIEGEDSVFVDVKGSVKKPGLYKVKRGERLKFVIDRAGGFTAEADVKLINLAVKVTDEMLIYVPEMGEVQSEIPVIQGEQGGSDETKINLNSATLDEFETLPGIGPAKAATFVQYRDENGPFNKIEDIKNISGIGDKTFEKLKDYIFVQ
ncbi:helix-hairpin-helix domain-containing protein [Mangrovibacillus sp. Mu-81]|uniref:helix-hairpin-helix domain-containing protein n=1 Tax=Mangrovibacillus sp. Mu-81 TaxID=3121478 RepID=UPI002FE4A5EA